MIIMKLSSRTGAWNPDIWLRILLALGAIALLRVGPRPHQVDGDLRQARAALSADQPEAASFHLGRAARSLPGRADLWEKAGQAALQAGDAQAAIYRLEMASARGFLSHQGWLALGDAFRALGAIERAIEIWQAAGPGTEVYARLADVYRQKRDYPAALENLEALSELKPGDAQLLYQIGLLLAATRPAQAVEPLEQAARLEARLARPAGEILGAIREAGRAQEAAYTFLAAGRALGAQGEWELAAEAFRLAAAARPDWPEAWAFLGEARQHLPDRDPARREALPSLEKALALDPDSLPANLFLALYWRRKQVNSLALEYLRRAAATDPENPALQAEIGSFFSEMGDLPAAQAYYEQAIRLAPEEAAYWRLLAQFCLEHGVQVRQVALPAARRAAILDPQDAASLDVMGHTLYLLGDYSNAERFLRRALQIDPDFAQARLHLGMNAWMQGQAENARQQLSLAIRLAPRSAIAEQAQRFLQRYLP